MKYILLLIVLIEYNYRKCLYADLRVTGVGGHSVQTQCLVRVGDDSIGGGRKEHTHHCEKVILDKVIIVQEAGDHFCVITRLACRKVYTRKLIKLYDDGYFYCYMSNYC